MAQGNRLGWLVPAKFRPRDGGPATTVGTVRIARDLLGYIESIEAIDALDDSVLKGYDVR